MQPLSHPIVEPIQYVCGWFLAWIGQPQMYKVIGGYIVYVTIGCDPLACGICKKYTSTFMYILYMQSAWMGWIWGKSLYPWLLSVQSYWHLSDFV